MKRTVLDDIHYYLTEIGIWIGYGLAVIVALLCAAALLAGIADQYLWDVFGDDAQQRRQSAPRHYEGWNSDETGSYFDFGGGVQSP